MKWYIIKETPDGEQQCWHRKQRRWVPRDESESYWYAYRSHRAARRRAAKVGGMVWHRTWRVWPSAPAELAQSDAIALRRLARRLHRWDALCCGDSRGCITVDDDGRAWWVSALDGTRRRVRNTGAAAESAAAAIAARYGYRIYRQRDPRGLCPLYLLPPGVHDERYWDGIPVPAAT